MSEVEEGLQRQAAAFVNRDFERGREELRLGQQREQTRLHDIRRQEVKGFEANREEAINRHWHGIQATDRREREAFAELDAQQRSLKGRITGIFKGGGHQEKQREQLAARFEADRMKQHRDLAALQERQAKAEQDKRLQHAAEVKRMDERHKEQSRDLGQWQEANRGRLTAQHADTLKQSRQQGIEQQLKQGFQELEREGRGHALTR